MAYQELLLGKDKTGIVALTDLVTDTQEERFSRLIIIK